jgi:hypothetical protein
MAEVLVKFDEPITAPSGEQYFAQAVGKEVRGGSWEGWLEFMPSGDGADTIESGRETTQPNRTNLEYWAQGLTKVYLEGALARALSLAANPNAIWDESETSRFNSAAGSATAPNLRSGPVIPRPVLDPFQVYAQGEAILRSELNALSRDHLEAIANAYDLKGGAASDLRSSKTAAIVEAIVEGVRAAR